MIEINRNQILEIKVHSEKIEGLSLLGKKQITMSFIDGPIEFEKPVYFMGCEFMVTAFKDIGWNEINHTYHAQSTGDCSAIEEFLKSIRPEKKIVKKEGKAVENIGDGKINMENEYPTTTPITDIEEIKKALRERENKESYFKMSNPNVFDTKTELDLIKARIEKLENLLK